ncbi:MAG: hypothetical protein IJV64_04185 [Oscillospiraceae bacterium]|nr:hypothetical protein [Oscillospiraceae bacterium]
MQTPKLIVMLTYNDRTVENAPEIFEACKASKAELWGFKEEGLAPEKMQALFRRMQDCGKQTALEVVAYTEAECMRGAALAAACGCDILMGTIYSDAIRDFCRENDLKYMPFVGEVTERPSILNGTAEGMIAEAKRYLERGVYGIDLLGYRYTGDAAALNRAVVAGVDAPVVIAGSVNSVERLREVKQTGAWGFTIGSAFFDGCFGDDIRSAIDFVCDYMEQA